MPLGPSGCILRASLVGDAHKYAWQASNECAAKALPAELLTQLLRIAVKTLFFSRRVRLFEVAAPWDTHALDCTKLAQ